VAQNEVDSINFRRFLVRSDFGYHVNGKSFV